MRLFRTKIEKTGEVMFEKRQVNWTKDWSLSEIYSGGLQMALCSPPDANGVYTKATTFVTCKDFFQDAVQAIYLGQKREIYDFHYDPATAPPLSLDRARILMSNNTDKEFATKIENVVDFVNQFEKRIHLLRTVAYECDPSPKKFGGVYMFEGSSRWMLSPPMISLYTLILRCGLVHVKGEDFDKTCKDIMNGTKSVGNKAKNQSGCNDDDYLRDGQAGIKAIQEHGYARLFYKDPAKNFPAKIGVRTMHNNCGIVGYSEKLMKDHMPYWFRLLEPQKKKKKKKLPQPV